MQKIRWGILGCGKIARKFASDLKLVKDASLVAVASRDEERAKEFSKTYHAELAFNSYDALVSSDKIDAIYIATPHGLHHEHALLCLKNKKAVLCEKALALNVRQVTEMIETSRVHKVFLMEAFWTKFLPQFQKVNDLINQGAIGKLKLIQADFGFRAEQPTPQRLFDPKLGGGALLDIGIYPVFMATSLLGRPDEVEAVMSPYPSGVDEQISAVLKFNDKEALAITSATFAAVTPVEATIVGTEGYIRMTNRFHNAVANIELINSEGSQPVPVHKEEGFGYQFEARHVGE
ncbi:MAG TPA: Gfo/Idh/MocA family oxidoreductase [Chryseolinea sp.]